MMRKKLPYWADQYVHHIQRFHPPTYAALKASGELELTAMQVQYEANDHYQIRKEYYQSLGYSDAQAEVEATGDTMNTYILLASDKTNDEFDDAPP